MIRKGALIVAGGSGVGVALAAGAFLLLNPSAVSHSALPALPAGGVIQADAGLTCVAPQVLAGGVCVDPVPGSSTGSAPSPTLAPSPTPVAKKATRTAKSAPSPTTVPAAPNVIPALAQGAVNQQAQPVNLVQQNQPTQAPAQTQPTQTQTQAPTTTKAPTTTQPPTTTQAPATTTPPTTTTRPPTTTPPTTTTRPPTTTPPTQTPTPRPTRSDD